MVKGRRRDGYKHCFFVVGEGHDRMRKGDGRMGERFRCEDSWFSHSCCRNQGEGNGEGHGGDLEKDGGETIVMMSQFFRSWYTYVDDVQHL